MLNIYYNYHNHIQQLAQIDQRERLTKQRHELTDQVKTPSTTTPMPTIQTKTDEFILLEKQGLCSQKLRNNLTGNLAQVTHTVGQNMTDISNIDNSTLIKVERKIFLSFLFTINTVPSSKHFLFDFFHLHTLISILIFASF